MVTLNNKLLIKHFSLCVFHQLKTLDMLEGKKCTVSPDSLWPPSVSVHPITQSSCSHWYNISFSRKKEENEGESTVYCCTKSNMKNSHPHPTYYYLLIFVVWNYVLTVQPQNLSPGISKDKTVTEKLGAWWIAAVKYHIIDQNLDHQLSP